MNSKALLANDSLLGSGSDLKAVGAKHFDLRAIFLLWRRELLRMLSEPSRLIGVLVQPLIFWFVIGSGFMPTFQIKESAQLSYQAYFYPGVLAMVILFTTIFSTITLIEDRNDGFLQAVLVGPGSRMAIVFGKIMGVVTIALIQAGLFLLIAPLAGISLAAVNFLLLFLFMFLGASALGGIGFIFAWWTNSSAAYHALMSLVLLPMWILSGAMFPPQVPWIEKVVAVNPMGWMVAGLRAAFSSGVAPMGTVPAYLSVPVCLGLLVAFNIFILMVAVWVCYRKR